MILRVFSLVFVLLSAAGGVLAQQQTPAPTPRRELYEVLAVGDRIFEPDIWLAGGQEYRDRTFAFWTAEEFGGISQAELLRSEAPVTPQDIPAAFNNAWFTEAFRAYESWTLTGQCSDDNATLYEFELVLEDTAYLVRYWAQAVSPQRVLTFQMLFPAQQRSRLDVYSARYRPSLPACL